MRWLAPLLVALATLAGVVGMTAAESRANQETSAVFVKRIPDGYRDWRLISVAREEGTLDDIRAILGNDEAIKAYREGTFGRSQSFVAGSPKNGVQFMVKDSKKYASTGGWGYAQFDDGKPADDEVLETCHPCHRAIEARDFVFTRYAR